MTMPSPRTSPEFAQLAEALHQVCAGSTPAYFANPGNWGDSLIRAGTIAFFRDHGLDFVPAYRKQIYHKKRLLPGNPFNEVFLEQMAREHRVAIYGGGGAWSEGHRSGGYPFVRSLCQHFSQVLVLPTSYQCGPVAGSVTYFARDTDMSMRAIPKARFCHDMALWLTPPSVEPLASIGTMLRTDSESLFRLGGVSGNFDVSRMGDELSDPLQFFLEVGRYRSIVTDRLHVAIAAGLLGRETYMLPGSYWKNHAIFHSSLQHACPTVHFVRSPEALPDAIRKHISPIGAD